MDDGSTPTAADPVLRILVTGSADGLGRATAQDLLDSGHEVVVHARGRQRLAALDDLVARGAAAVVGDLSDPEQTRDVAEQVDRLGPMDVVVHNAGVYTGRAILPVNVVAPYLLTALLQRPRRLVYLSSGMHRGGRADLTGMDWTGRTRTGTYSDSKLFVTALAMAVARLLPDVCVSAVDPGWVRTRMGGSGAPDDLEVGTRTQEWLAVSDAPDALASGGYWHHGRREDPHPAVHDPRFQDDVLAALERFTGTALVRTGRGAAR